MSELDGKTLVNRYRIERLIGRGGMAEVYRGTDTVLERPVAVKILTDRSDDIRKRFLREAQAMAQLNHPNIVAVYDAGEMDGLFFIIMELVDGRTLRDIAISELTFHTALRYLIDMLHALAFAHAREVVHRDVKPANVMVVGDNVKMMDFGLSRRTSDMSQATQAGAIVGTIAYLPPERFLGNTADARGDLYSVGVMMYELFTGTVPFKSPSDDLVAVIFSHVNDKPKSPRAVNPNVPAPLERIILKLLEKEPERRYQSAPELIAELQSLLAPDDRQAAKPKRAANGPAEPVTVPMPTRRSADPTVREALDKAFGPTRSLNDAFGNVLQGMLATRRREYDQAETCYAAALATLKNVNNELEYVKTALKFAVMLRQKNAELPSPNYEDIERAVALLNEALPVLRGRSMKAEVEEGERTLQTLRRLGIS